MTAATDGRGTVAKEWTVAKHEGEPGLVSELREAIRGSGQSLRDLGRACGVGGDRLSRFMRGERDLTLGAAEKICRALGLRLTGRKK